MKIPERLKVGGHWYKIVCPHGFTERGDRNADHDPGMKTIRIDVFDSWSHQKKPDSSIAVSFLHELLHACDFQTGNRLFIDQDGEAKIEAFSEALYQVLHDNKLKFFDD